MQTRVLGLLREAVRRKARGLSPDRGQTEPSQPRRRCSRRTRSPAGARRSVRESPHARARRMRRGPRAPLRAPAGIGGAVLRLRGHWAYVPVRPRARPATLPRVVDRPRLPLGLAPGSARTVDLPPRPARRAGVAPATSGPTSTRCVGGRYTSTGPGPVASRSAPATGIWSGLWELRSTPVTRLLNGLGCRLPDRSWRWRPLLGVMSRVAGVTLGAGRVRLVGVAPNGQRFLANPLTMWVASASRARIGGSEPGETGPAPEQAHLRDSALPQRGMFAVGLPLGALDRKRLRRAGPSTG
jgi:hypothetical protein